MNEQQRRLVGLEHALGINAEVCPVCRHRTGANRCQDPATEAELTARLDKAIKDLIEAHGEAKRELAQLKGEL